MVDADCVGRSVKRYLFFNGPLAGQWIGVGGEPPTIHILSTYEKHRIVVATRAAFGDSVLVTSSGTYDVYFLKGTERTPELVDKVAAAILRRRVQDEALGINDGPACGHGS